MFFLGWGEMADFNNSLNNIKDTVISQQNEINFLKKDLIKKENYEKLNDIIISQRNELDELKKDLAKKDEFLKSLPQLSQTSVGKSIFDGKLVYRNWWSAYIPEYEGFCEKIWFSRFLMHHFPDADYKINMFSVFGNHFNINEPMEGKKVFFSGENLNKRFTFFNENFGPYALDYVDFAMGYDLVDNEKYLRFPLWIIWNFLPDVTEEDIENIINGWNSINYEKSKDVVVVSSHDLWNTRALIVDDIKDFVDITYGGKWRNNSSELWDKFNDNKIEYTKQFKFNVCPENVLDTAYVTEKIFDAIKCDCIPLYAGGKDYLEPKMLNPNAIITWDFDKDNSDSVELFKTLMSDEKSYKEFKDQDILLDSSVKFVIKKFNKLKKHFENLIYE